MDGGHSGIGLNLLLVLFTMGSGRRTYLDGGYSGVGLNLLLVLSTLVLMSMSAVVTLPFYFNESQWLVPPTFYCPQGLKYHIFFFVVLANTVIIHKLLDMNTNLTYPPTLSYDKGIAYS